MRLPKIKLEDIEDIYTYYVMILGISEDIFWNYDISMVRWIAEDKAAYEGYMAAIRENEFAKKR